MGNKKEVDESSTPSADVTPDCLPAKSKVLRAKSIQKRLETERNKNAPLSALRQQQQQQQRRPGGSRHHAAMSRYRRKSANAKERDRMRHVNEAFERLKDALPAGMVHSEDAKGTKVDTLRWAIGYINSLQTLLEDSERGALDPGLYGGDLEEDSGAVGAKGPKKKRGKGDGGRRRKKKAQKTKKKRLQHKQKQVKTANKKATASSHLAKGKSSSKKSSGGSSGGGGAEASNQASTAADAGGGNPSHPQAWQHLKLKPASQPPPLLLTSCHPLNHIPAGGSPQQHSLSNQPPLVPPPSTVAAAANAAQQQQHKSGNHKVVLRGETAAAKQGTVAVAPTHYWTDGHTTTFSPSGNVVVRPAAPSSSVALPQQILSQLQPVSAAECLGVQGGGNGNGVQPPPFFFPPSTSTSTPGALASPSGSSTSGSDFNDSNMSVGSVSPRNSAFDVGKNAFGGPTASKPTQFDPNQHHNQHHHHQGHWYGGILDDIEAVLKQDENFDMLVNVVQQ